MVFEPDLYNPWSTLLTITRWCVLLVRLQQITLIRVVWIRPISYATGARARQPRNAVALTVDTEER